MGGEYPMKYICIVHISNDFIFPWAQKSYHVETMIGRRREAIKKSFFLVTGPLRGGGG